jgi:hypothetical protein
MDFGFGTFLEKFEEHFGKWPLRILLLLVGLAVALFCADMIWNLALGPVVKNIVSGGFAEGLSFALWTGIAWFFGFSITMLIATSLTKWRHKRALRRMLDRTEALDAQMKQDFNADVGKLDQLSERAETALKEIEAMRAELKQRLQENDSKA